MAMIEGKEDGMAVLLMGDGAVGKTSLIIAFATNAFPRGIFDSIY